MGRDSCSHVASTPATSRDPEHVQRVSCRRTSLICASRFRQGLVVPCGKSGSLGTGLDHIIGESSNARRTRQSHSWPDDFRRGRRDNPCLMTVTKPGTWSNSAMSGLHSGARREPWKREPSLSLRAAAGPKPVSSGGQTAPTADRRAPNDCC